MSLALRRLLAVSAAGTVIVLALSITGLGTAPHAGAGGNASGGKAVAHHAGGSPVNSAAVRRNAPRAELHPVQLKKGFPPIQAGEPTMGITKDGDLFYVALPGRSEVVRSPDEGNSWKVVSPEGPTRHRITFDPYIYVDEDTNRLFTIDLTVACSYLSYSDDGGKSWFTNPLACGRPVNDHQTLFSGPPALSPTAGYDNVVYYCWNDVASSSCSKSLDGGITFVDSGAPAFPGVNPEDPGGEDEGDPLCGGLHGHGHVGRDGTVYLPRGYCGQPFLAISHDEGATWQRVQVAGNGIAHHEAGVSTDEAGNVYYTWVARDRLPYLAVSRDGGKTFGKPLMIGSPGVNESNLPGIDVGEIGKVAIVYMGTTNSPGEPFPQQGGSGPTDCLIPQVSCAAPKEYKNTTWNGYMTVSANALDKNPVFYSGTVNPPRDPLKRGICGPGRCGLDILDFLDVNIAPDGSTWGAFVDACIGSCATGERKQDAGSDGITGHLVGGPSLR